jgi:nitroreductase
MGLVENVIDNRRSLRALDPLGLTDTETRDLADHLLKSAVLAPSADNSQPWRFVAVYEKGPLDKIRAALAAANQWASACSLFIVVCGSPVLGRTGPSDSGKNGPINYYLFDTGIASAFLMLRATDADLVAHPLAGFDAGKVADAIRLDQSGVSALEVIALVALGRKSTDGKALARVPPVMLAAETTRPVRRPFEEIVFHNGFAKASAAVKGPAPEPDFDRDIILVNDDGKIYHIDQATLNGMISVDELDAQDQVEYGFIKELTDLGISVATIPTIKEMNASIFCYLLNLGGLKFPDPNKGTQVAGTPSPSAKRTAGAVKTPRRRRGLQYSGCDNPDMP